MAKCKICGRESGSYEYCEECFQKIENGETAKCVLCGQLYIKGTRCRCTKINEPIEVLNTFNDEYQRNQASGVSNTNVYVNRQKEKSQGKGCIISITIIFIILVLAIIVPHAIENKQRNDSIKYKQNAPEISVGDTSNITDLNKIIIEVKCKNNYKKVEVLLELSDESGKIIKSETMTGYNYKKGETYELIYTLNTYELLNAKKYRYSLIDYELK